MRTNPESSDYYEILQISPLAEAEIIEAAYSALLIKHESNKSSASKKIVRQITEAFKCLSNPESRKSYDKNRNADLTGTVIGDYRLIEHLASGGFGSTYRGEHILTGQPVCIKDCHLISPEDNKILLQEAIAMWDLRHFSIPTVRNVIRLDDGRLILVMSFIPGMTLEKVVQKIGEVPAEHVSWIMERILNALKYIHYYGVIHGDIKPQNIIIQPETHTISIVDFGLSMIKPTASSDSKGYTPYFAPPEQMKRSTLLPESDFYSLGLTMIYALSGDMQSVKRRSVPEGTPNELCDFIKRLIVRDLINRPNWEKEDLGDTIQKVRAYCFGRTTTNLRPIPGL